MNPEIVAVVDRIQTVLEEREGERKVYQMASPQSEEPAISLTSENTEPSKALNGYSRKDVEEMVLFSAQAELEEMELSESVKLLGARVYGSRTRDGLFEDSSDIDVVLSFDAPNGVLYEDTFFNAQFVQMGKHVLSAGQIHFADLRDLAQSQMQMQIDLFHRITLRSALRPSQHTSGRSSACSD